MNTLNKLAAVAVLGFGVATSAQAVPIAADVLFVVDESGSMAGEHSWLGNMISGLESGLTARGVGDGATVNNYGLVGYGGVISGPSQGPRQVAVGGSAWGSASDFSTATGTLTTRGGLEDGWQAINYALGNYTFRAGTALNIILVTDEDRDENSTDTYTSTLDAIQRYGGLLNTVVNCNFAANGGSPAIGVDSDGNGYVADGAGGYTTSTTGSQSGSCAGTTMNDYVDMAWATGGAAWDLNILRAGGNDALSFTSAFVDVKVEEIVTHPVPEPGSLALLGLGLVGMGFAKKRSAEKLVA